MVLFLFFVLFHFSNSQLYGYVGVSSQSIQEVNVTIRDGKQTLTEIGTSHPDFITDYYDGAVDSRNGIFYLLASHNDVLKLVGLSTTNGKILKEIEVPKISGKNFPCPESRPSVLMGSTPEIVFITIINDIDDTFYCFTVDVESEKVTQIPVKDYFFALDPCSAFNPDLDEIYMSGLSKTQNYDPIWVCVDAKTGKEKFRLSDDKFLSAITYEKSSKLLWGITNNETSQGKQNLYIQSFNPETKEMNLHYEIPKDPYLDNGLMSTMDEMNRIIYFWIEHHHYYQYVCTFDIMRTSFDCTLCNPNKGCALGLSFKKMV